MSKAKFTPGPWYSSSNCLMVDTNGGTDIDLIGYSEHKDPSQAEANADLIAAAPEMYEALEDLIKCMPKAKLSDDQYQAKLNAVIALSKARGES